MLTAVLYVKSDIRLWLGLSRYICISLHVFLYLVVLIISLCCFMCLGGKSVDGLLVRCRVARDMDFSVGHGLDCLGFPTKTEADFAELGRL